jgi:hypothetical protein
MKTIKIYNVKEAVENDKDNPGYTTFREHELAIIEGETNYLVFYNEGIGALLNKTEGYEIEVVKEPEPNTFKIFPELIFKYALEELTALNYREDTLVNFIRVHGSRLESNYTTIRNSIIDLGLNPEEYGPESRKYERAKI